jgi:hypothetical protein
VPRRGCGTVEGDSAFEDLGFEEGLHKLVVGAVAQRLRLVAHRAGVFARRLTLPLGEAAHLCGNPVKETVHRWI